MKTIDSPVGTLKLVVGDEGLTAILWDHDGPNRVRLGETMPSPDHPLLRRVETQLADYFAGRRKRFDLPLAMSGTAFQQKVWAALLDIPYGATRTYRDIATAIGKPTASRAVGAAVGRNPISIVAPCHRVVGTSGALTGFAGGLDTKRYLLALENGQRPLAA